MASAQSRARGETLAGKYRLGRALGSGNMGTVFRAVDLATDRPVAVKRIRPEHASDRAFVARFLREAKAAEMVRHPNVVEVLDGGVDANGTPFIVHELLEGRPLARHLADAGPLPASAALRILVPVVEAIAHAHAQGVIHRDLNPSNIFLSTEPGAREATPKVLDFGVSKIRTEHSTVASTAGMAIGTPAYMPPEQVRGRGVDARADVWAIGAILFEMASGRLPFVATDTSSIFIEICTTTAPRLDAVVPGVPRELADVVERCLRPKPQERYADGKALLEALRSVQARVTDSLDTADTETARRRRSRRMGLAVTLGIAAVGVLGAVVAWLLSAARR